MGIGVHENKPIAGSSRGAAIAGAANLVDRFEYRRWRSAARAISAVRSVELLSQRINSVDQPLSVKPDMAARMEARLAARSFSSLKAGTTRTEIFKSASLAPHYARDSSEQYGPKQAQLQSG